MSFRRNVILSIRGISTSSVRTSGCNDVKRKDIGLQCDDFVACYISIKCGADYFYAGMLIQIPGEYLARHSRIIDY
ncbi:MAG: hypothetical protein ACYS9C_06955 [Planctomycetota bacterium]